MSIPNILREAMRAKLLSGWYTNTWPDKSKTWWVCPAGGTYQKFDDVGIANYADMLREAL